MDKTWNVMVDGCGCTMGGTTERVARALYKPAVEEEPYETVELIHGEETVQRHN